MKYNLRPRIIVIKRDDDYTAFFTDFGIKYTAGDLEVSVDKIIQSLVSQILYESLVFVTSSASVECWAQGEECHYAGDFKITIKDWLIPGFDVRFLDGNKS